MPAHGPVRDRSCSGAGSVRPRRVQHVLDQHRRPPTVVANVVALVVRPALATVVASVVTPGATAVSAPVLAAVGHDNAHGHGAASGSPGRISEASRTIKVEMYDMY